MRKESAVVGHVLQHISAIATHFLAKASALAITCKVTWHRKYSYAGNTYSSYVASKCLATLFLLEKRLIGCMFKRLEA